jgi:hypothetical protein
VPSFPSANRHVARLEYSGHNKHSLGTPSTRSTELVPRASQTSNVYCGVDYSAMLPCVRQYRSSWAVHMNAETRQRDTFLFGRSLRKLKWEEIWFQTGGRLGSCLIISGVGLSVRCRKVSSTYDIITFVVMYDRWFEENKLRAYFL